MLSFNLDKDIVFFDLEATGLNVVTDKIVQIALIKYFADGREAREWVSLINPEMKISKEAQSVHGISSEMVRSAPTFKEVAQELFQFIGESDLAGYNSNRFDIPMLIEEFARAGYDLDMGERRTIDVQKIFYRMEPRTLSAALKFYCDKEMENAHDALADVRATVDILRGQIEKYAETDIVDSNGGIIRRPVKNDMEALYRFTQEVGMVDATRRLKYDSKGEIVFNFGKFIGKPVGKTLYDHPQYYKWIQDKEFSHQLKQITKKLLDEAKQKQKEEGK